jgi:transcriptional regulator with XRE-family HTH domain
MSKALDFENVLSRDQGTYSDPVLQRLGRIFASVRGTTYRHLAESSNLFEWGSDAGSSITGTPSVQAPLRVLLPADWHDVVANAPEVRIALQGILGRIASGQSSVNDLLRGWSDVLSVSGLLRVVSGGDVIEIDALQAAASSPARQPQRSTQDAAGSVEKVSPVHSRLARELREMSGLSAGKLASAFGVTREQYSRWVSGAAISDIRHGQLRYLHTVVADLVRRFGSLDETHVWFQTPTEGSETPADLLLQRRWSDLHRLVTDVHDPAPLVGGVRVGLLAPIREEEDNLDELDEAEGEDSWSPYASGND